MIDLLKDSLLTAHNPLILQAFFYKCCFATRTTAGYPYRISSSYKSILLFYTLPGVINSLKNTDKEFYLIEKNGKQFFVTVTDEFIETRQLAKRIDTKKIEIGNWKFTKCAYEVK